MRERERKLTVSFHFVSFLKNQTNRLHFSRSYLLRQRLKQTVPQTYELGEKESEEGGVVD